MNLNEINIANVSIKKSGTDFELVTLHQFLKKSALDRFNLIKEKKVEFIDFEGVKIDLLKALKSITELIKNLREDGSYHQIFME